jgi:hypothetical protein
MAAEKHTNAASYGFTGSLSDIHYEQGVSRQLGRDPNDGSAICGRTCQVAEPERRHRTSAPSTGFDGVLPLAAIQEAIARDDADAVNPPMLCPPGEP